MQLIAQPSATTVALRRPLGPSFAPPRALNVQITWRERGEWSCSCLRAAAAASGDAPQPSRSHEPSKASAVPAASPPPPLPAPSSPQLAPAQTPTPASVPADLLLSDVRVVLVAPKHEANVGAVARAAANFECLNLFVVAPRCAGGGTDGWAGEARKVACGDAVLDRAVVVGTLAEALVDTAGSIGFTRRAGATRVTHASLGHLLAEFPFALLLQPPHPQQQPEQQCEQQQQQQQQQQQLVSAQEQQECPEASIPEAGGPLSGSAGAGEAGEDPVAAGGTRGGVGNRAACTTALVFGREESGLTEAELRLCSYACGIPTGRVQPSMNLSHAVSTVLAELFSRRCGLLTVASATDVEAATVAMGAQDDRTTLLKLPTTSSSGSSSGTSNGNSSESSSNGIPGISSLEASSAGAAIGPFGRVGVAGLVTPAPGTAAPGAAVAAGGGGGGGSSSGGGAVDAGLLPARAQEVELLIRKVAAVAEAVGLSGAEGTGGGNGGNHGRRRLPVGHLRSVVSRARMNAGESRSLHGLASAVLQHVAPNHPLEARKQQRKQQQPQRQQQQDQPGQQQENGTEEH